MTGAFLVIKYLGNYCASVEAYPNLAWVRAVLAETSSIIPRFEQIFLVFGTRKVDFIRTCCLV